LTLRCAIVPPAPAPYREPFFRALDAHPDVEISVIYQSGGQPSWDVAPDWFVADHLYPARHLLSWQRGRPGRTPVVWPRGLERALRSSDPACAVVMEYGLASVRTLRWCRRNGRAFVIFSDCTPQINDLLPPAQLRLHRWLARRADGVIAVSSAGRDRLLAFGVAPERITVALQSGDLEPVRAAAGRRAAPSAPSASTGTAAPAPPAEPVTVLAAGRLVPDKNFATLIEAFSRLRLAPERARLEIAGTGFAAPELRGLAERLAVPVRFHGPVAAARMPELYAGADIFALVSTYEPFGVVIREAVAASLPVVCSRTAGAAGDVAVDGRNAILVDPDRPDEVAAALSRLIADGSLRERMGAESRAIDAAIDGQDVDAFVTAVTGATRSAGRTSSRSRRTWTLGR
jgi:glycosyltransferase involved in cell wall biosynthesis